MDWVPVEWPRTTKRMIHTRLKSKLVTKSGPAFRGNSLEADFGAAVRIEAVAR